MFIFKRNDIYYVEFYDDIKQKKRRLSTNKTTKADALKFVSKLAEKLNVQVKPVAIKLSLFKDEYLNYTTNIYSVKYIKSIKLSFRILEEFLGDPPISQISEKEVERFLALIHRRAKHASQLYKRTLSAAFNKAISWEYINYNPFLKIKSPKMVRRFPVTVSEHELSLILDKVKIKQLMEIFLIAYYTGMRQNEIANLKWAHINLGEKIITVKNSEEFTTKSKKERIIPISKHIINKLMEMHDHSQSEYAFPNKRGVKYHPDTLSHKFKVAVREAGLSDEIHFHTLRHSFASNLVRQGVSLYIVMELLGHNDISTTQIYSHLDRTSLVSAVDIL